MMLTDPLTGMVTIPAKPQGNGRPQRAARNNNPGNLRFAGQAGAKKGEHGFAVFETPEAGAQALYEQVLRDAKRGLTTSQFLTKYAPPVENDTKRYLARMRKALNASADTPLAEIDPFAVTQFVAHQESNTDLSRFQPRKDAPMPELPEGDLTTKALVAGLKVMDKLKRGAKKVGEWNTKAGRDIASALPVGTDLQQGLIPDYIGGPASKTKWAVVTAANPGGKMLSAEGNIPLMQKLEKILRKFKIDYVPSKGQYPSGDVLIKDEPSFILPSIAEPDARALGHAMRQDGILSKRGYVKDAGVYHPSSGVREATDADVAWFEGPDGTKIVSDVDWDTVKPLKALKVKHYSQGLGGEIGDVRTLDPAFQGTGLPGKEVARTGRMKMSHVYKRGATPERQFADMPMYVGETTRPIYDISDDPLGVITQMSQGGTRAVDRDAMERLVTRLLGYGGYKNRDIAPNTIKLAEPLQVTRKR